MPIRILVEDVVGDLLHLIAGLNLFQYRIGDHLLLDQFSQLDGRHLQHLDPLPQLRREDHFLLHLMVKP